MAEKKAHENGMTVSELGRMLFGAFVVRIAKPSLDISPEFIAIAEEASKNYKKGLGTLASTKDELESYLAAL